MAISPEAWFYHGSALSSLLPGGPSEPPDHNFETLYASLVGIVFVFGVVWYLLFLRPDILDSLWASLREDYHAMCRAAREDFHSAKNLICYAEEEVKEMRTCVACGKEFVNGVIVQDEDYCASCSLNPTVFKKAQEAYMNKEI